MVLSLIIGTKNGKKKKKGFRLRNSKTQNKQKNKKSFNEKDQSVIITAWKMKTLGSNGHMEAGNWKEFSELHIWSDTLSLISIR